MLLFSSLSLFFTTYSRICLVIRMSPCSPVVLKHRCKQWRLAMRGHMGKGPMDLWPQRSLEIVLDDHKPCGIHAAVPYAAAFMRQKLGNCGHSVIPPHGVHAATSDLVWLQFLLGLQYLRHRFVTASTLTIREITAMSFLRFRLCKKTLRHGH